MSTTAGVSATRLQAQLEADTTLLLDSCEGLLQSAQVRAAADARSLLNAPLLHNSDFSRRPS